MPFWNLTKKVLPVAGTDVAGSDVAVTDVAGIDAEIRKGKLFASLYMLNQFYDIKHIGDTISDQDQSILIELITLANKNYFSEFNSEYSTVFESEVKCELPEFISKLKALQTKVTLLKNTSLDTLLNILIESLEGVNKPVGGGRNKASRKTKKRKHRK
jgi:hypothetical protein